MAVNLTCFLYVYVIVLVHNPENCRMQHSTTYFKAIMLHKSK